MSFLSACLWREGTAKCKSLFPLLSAAFKLLLTSAHVCVLMSLVCISCQCVCGRKETSNASLFSPSWSIHFATHVCYHVSVLMSRVYSYKGVGGGKEKQNASFFPPSLIVYTSLLMSVIMLVCSCHSCVFPWKVFVYHTVFILCSPHVHFLQRYYHVTLFKGIIFFSLYLCHCMLVSLLLDFTVRFIVL